MIHSCLTNLINFLQSNKGTNMRFLIITVALHFITKKLKSRIIGDFRIKQLKVGYFCPNIKLLSNLLSDNESKKYCSP